MPQLSSRRWLVERLEHSRHLRSRFRSIENKTNLQNTVLTAVEIFYLAVVEEPICAPIEARLRIEVSQLTPRQSLATLSLTNAPGLGSVRFTVPANEPTNFFYKESQPTEIMHLLAETASALTAV